MGFSCGIVGLPNVGKSTLFNALTRSRVPAENYPFCTIDPSTGVVPVPDSRLEKMAARVRPQRVVPTTVEFVDIAGLVRGASQGEGLGNQFLGHIRQVDAIAHVVRCFEDTNVAHVSSRLDPKADIETINTELILADLQTVERAVKRVGRETKSGDPEAKAKLRLLERLEPHLDQMLPARSLELSTEDRRRSRQLHLLTSKPTLYVANVEEGAEEHPAVAEVRAIAEGEGAEVVVLCNRLEAELAELETAERDEMLAELGLEEPGLDRFIHAGYRLLGLLTFFTASSKEVRAWTVPAGASAYKAAGLIHSDFQRGFIRAQVIAYDDFVAHGEQGAKEAGKRRSEGRDYVVQEGDVILFLFNV